MELVAFKDLPYIKVGSKWYMKIKNLYLGFDLKAALTWKFDRVYTVTKIDTSDKEPTSKVPNKDIYIHLSNDYMDVSIPYGKNFEKIFKEVTDNDGL